MHRVTSATSVLSLDDLEDDAAKAPRFTRRNYSPAAIIDGATLKHRSADSIHLHVKRYVNGTRRVNG